MGLSLIHIYGCLPAVCNRCAGGKPDYGYFICAGRPDNPAEIGAAKMEKKDRIKKDISRESYLQTVIRRFKQHHLATVSLVTVSYTHLDVYKRQKVHSAELREKDAARQLRRAKAPD